MRRACVLASDMPWRSKRPGGGGPAASQSWQMHRQSSRHRMPQAVHL